MAEQIYYDSNYRFSDPVRFFKANDPYYFEVDNIPLKQLQENCLWLKDQVRKDSTKLLGVKRADLDELRPYATGADRVLRVKPGRYTARINDTSKTPLAYIEKVMGMATGEVDGWVGTLPGGGSGNSLILEAALDTFKQSISQEAMGMTGLAERAFTWPLINSDTPIDNDGVDLVGQSSGGIPSEMSYSQQDNIPGGSVWMSPMVVAQALLWASTIPGDTTNFLWGGGDFSTFPKIESSFIKKWRGVSRLAIVDVDDEISIEVPQFDPDDFSYINSEGTLTQVTGVQSRIDLVFIYSKPIDSSGVTILTPSIPGKLGITKPTLGIVRGAGIRANFYPVEHHTDDHMQNLNDDHGILAHPGDQKNINMGFTATSGNDLLQDIRGSFPAPDDILNIAPLISEKLEDNAYELIGQSILPVAYVWVQNGSQVVLSTDVIDIRPMFRTAELAYNERAGIGAAMPQLSLANPAVGKGQLDYELKRVHDDLTAVINNPVIATTNSVATGYVFGGWNFGPESALYDFWQYQFFYGDDDPDNDNIASIQEHIKTKYSFGSAMTQVNIPYRPDWDLSQWCTVQNVQDKGNWPNDYLNTYISQNTIYDPNNFGDFVDQSLVGGSAKVFLDNNGLTEFGQAVSRTNRMSNTANFAVGHEVAGLVSRANFMYVAKKIKFNRPSWLADYRVDVDLINCIAACERGTANSKTAGSYFGCWVEKGIDEFTIYVSCVADDNNYRTGNDSPFPAPTVRDGVLISERGGERFSGFAVMVSDLLGSNLNPIADSSDGGYQGNPRIGKCTLPTVMWNMTGIPFDDSAYHYGNLNDPDTSITIRGGS
tara:strand:- start:173 stop:2647 length:2475 start_codon:yes stop_codon:yes gene_type:complete